MKQPCVYIMASRRNGTLYTGVTSNLPKRALNIAKGWSQGFPPPPPPRFWFGTSFTAA